MDPRQKGSVIVEVLIGINSRLADLQLRHELRVDLLPCPLESTNRWGIETRDDRSHRREVLQDATALEIHRAENESVR